MSRRNSEVSATVSVRTERCAPDKPSPQRRNKGKVPTQAVSGLTWYTDHMVHRTCRRLPTNPTTSSVQPPSSTGLQKSLGFGEKRSSVLGKLYLFQRPHFTHQETDGGRTPSQSHTAKPQCEALEGLVVLLLWRMQLLFGFPEK